MPVYGNTSFMIFLVNAMVENDLASFNYDIILEIILIGVRLLSRPFVRVARSELV